MSDFPEPSIRIRVDPTNPGQFFACCGLLELANNLCDEATGAFIPSTDAFLFEVHLPTTQSVPSIITNLAKCDLTSSLTEQQLQRLKQLMNKGKNKLTEAESRENKVLKDLWDRERIHIGSPYDLWIDWWNDDYAGGSILKTWAGRQFITDIARGVQSGLRYCYDETRFSEALNVYVNNGNLPLYFDSDIGGHSSSLDVGYSLDALEIRAVTRPAIELLAFVGLQRFRPMRDRENDIFTYNLWTNHLPCILAAVTTSGALDSETHHRFGFQLLYRTKYLKSFLSAKPNPKIIL